MKKLLFTAYDMNLGGIETSLVTLLNYLANKEYDITLLLEKKQGIFLNELNSTIHVIEYTPSNHKNVLIRKMINLVKRVKFILKYKNKFDFAASYATYSRTGSFAVRCASKNNALWGHADYLALYYNDIKKVKKFFDELHYNQFKNIVFVSKAACDTFTQIYPDMKNRTIYCNNLVNYNRIEKMAKENIKRNKEDVYTFLNIGRHEERQKRLTRLIEAAKKLKEDNLKFKILFVGAGPNSDEYKELVRNYNLEDYIEFIGTKKNPYPYFNICDSVILTSDYEGYPVVFLESFVLKKPIITTDISDAVEQVEGKFGKVTTKDVKDIYITMKDFIENGYIVKENFDPEKYNQEIIQTLERIMWS